jgi:acyl carrier protein
MIKRSEILEIINSVKTGNYSINDSLNLIDDGILDSFSILVLVTELNTKYGISISIDDKVRDIFCTVDSILEYINSQS